MKLISIVFPKELEKEFEIPENAIIFWLYWEPLGDECILGYLLKDGTIGEETSSWTAFLKLKDLNPHLSQYKLGDSDNEAEEVLLIDRRTKEAYIVKRSYLGAFLKKLLLI